MNFAVDTLHDIQRQLGGLMVYLECEEKEPLLKFYQEKNGFRLFVATFELFVKMWILEEE